MDDEDYGASVEWILRVIDKLASIPERYLIDEDVIVEIPYPKKDF